MPKLFTRFGKLKRTAAINSAGIGLGLMIVKQIVETGGGQIKVKSDGLEKGSKFSFSMQMVALTEISDDQDKTSEQAIVVKAEQQRVASKQL